MCLIRLLPARLIGTTFGTRVVTVSPTVDILETSIPEVLFVNVYDVASTLIAFDLAIM